MINIQNANAIPILPLLFKTSLHAAGRALVIVVVPVTVVYEVMKTVCVGSTISVDELFRH